ncbi:Electroneutral sodium bicarbonate exchanger 1 [Seminavis robusta]|uniref:Electroneutral sodium bicarbonate exchanger 1 n=1 Tax=Seminavis robusta TaxID=568900 RepID=A0A9N8DMI4_9STRA|nr:Electroneutral sodium bicarbonate exchanger 1 [Seminavis robusta]|eukprot:Sro215_g089070.1 Electroneutral sodium bicarbonate exchanger 1 (784) ;mRNA; f:50896-53942
MQRSNSAPDLIEVSETDFTSGHFDHHENPVKVNDKVGGKERLRHQKQISGLTTVTTNSNEQHHGDNSEALVLLEAEEEEEEAEHGESGGGWGRGIISDFKRTVGTHWVQEMTNFNQQTVAVSFFIFFAAIAPAITFGAIYAKATHNWIGAVEMITATAWCGIVYSLIGGQPMMINGGTGPVLAFTEIIFKMSESLDVPFLTFNCWVGIWVCIFMCLAAFTDLNRIIVYATRFTDEIFALLIAFIFIINALGNPFATVGLAYYFQPDHKSHEKHANDPDYNYLAAALLSFLLCIGVVQTAFALRKTKFSPFLPNQTMRNVVTDFAVVASIAFWTFVDQVIFKSIPTETLNVPDSFAPTYACCTESCETNWPDDCPDLAEPFGRRGWFVDIGDLNGKGWVPLMAAGPAILAFILVFLDDGITWHLINHPSHKLTHGAAYNYDTLIIGVMILVNSLLGLPWLVAATVRSLNHVHALAEKTPQGKIVSVRETRLTHLGIHGLCFVSIFALNILKIIPMPVLYGVFLFMGLVSLGTNQFFGRVQMFLMQPSKYPVEPYTQYVKPNRMRLFTAIQLGLFVLLYVVKAIKTIAIAFPIIIALCIPVRLYVLPRIFTTEELVMIDSDEATVRKWLARKKAETEKHVSFDEDDVEKQQGAIAEDANDEGDSSRKDGDQEHDDVILGLPTKQDLDPSKRTERRQRRKSLSCPEHSLFFSSEMDLEDADADAATDDGTSMDEGSSYASEDDAVPVVPLGERIRMRGRRRKSLSCPPHQLFNEAERYLNKNYFFG